MAKKTMNLFTPSRWSKADQETFLDKWYELDSNSWDKYFDEANVYKEGVGESMIVLLKINKPKFYGTVLEDLGWTKFLTSDNETWWHSTVRPRNAKAPSKRKTLSWKANKKGKFPKEPEVIWRD